MLAESSQLLAAGGKTPSIDALVRGGSSQGDALALKNKGEDMDPLETLMTRLGVARNRSEKRRLLAEYNQHQELIWGQARSIKALDISKEVASLTLKANAKHSQDPTKVYNELTHSYMDRDLYMECLKPEKRSANTKAGDQKNQKKLT
jgi:hypothetical protein